MNFTGKNKRIKTLMIILAVLIVLLIVRLFYIQIICHDRFSEATNNQYEISVQGLDTRGMILDRNMNPLTGGTYRYYYIIKKNMESNDLHKLLDEIEAVNITKKSSKYNVYCSETYNPDINEKLIEGYGAYGFKSRARYSDDQTACHLIGYLNDSEKRGVSGLELLYENRLRSSNSCLTLLADGGGNILKGYVPSVRLDPKIKSKIIGSASLVSTIDIGLQRKCEELLEKQDTAASCVVADSRTGEILAMASYPTFNPNIVSNYLYRGSCLVNHTIQSEYAPGSIFKLVVAAAALENGVATPETKFKCDGSVTVESIKINCSSAPEGGHGNLNMCDALACSCNCYFAQLGREVGYEKILEMAKKMGFGQCCLAAFPEEKSGNVPLVQNSSASDTTNLSIGQGSLLVTPLQAARMTAIIANKGKEIKLNVVKEGLEFSDENTNRVISEETAQNLEKFMFAVTDYGTAGGKEWNYPAWGKSGTAEGVWFGKKVKTCWFTGFCETGRQAKSEPEEKHRYVITVNVEKGDSGSKDALPIFREIGEYLQSGRF